MAVAVAMAMAKAMAVAKAIAMDKNTVLANVGSTDLRRVWA